MNKIMTLSAGLVALATGIVELSQNPWFTVNVIFGAILVVGTFATKRLEWFKF